MKARRLKYRFFAKCGSRCLWGQLRGTHRTHEGAVYDADGQGQTRKKRLHKRQSRPIRSERKMLEFAYSFAGPASQRRDSMVGEVLGTH